MIVRVARRVHRPHRGPFDPKHLPVDNGLLRLVGRVLVDGALKVGVQTEQVGHAARVVAVPVGEEHVREGDAQGVEGRGDEIRPFGDALARVDDEAGAARADDPGVCALEGEFPFVLAEDAEHPRCDLGYVRERGEGGHLRGEVVLKGADVEGFVDLAVAAPAHVEGWFGLGWGVEEMLCW